ncbi:DUF928 domain-containing protein [aff. Roholtiella sp. LEGE 12411]|uniref:DUF928 domain-containing protein n=1 Tax=aff. Roholtiella sp. LEGE 12411 TaxID=1828822 RepID=UPI0018819615|nr:DUF928 domain-containing protein [aff. Roholtiella sp. LEGE 12411]MBE9037116.1 DUF928 domain-containing protein [aff. Roholtiella sp. LEGE 12411]
MKSNSQSITLLLILTFSYTSLLSSLTSVLAKPTLPASARSQVVRFAPPPPPPGPPPGGRPTGGASRGGSLSMCPTVKTQLTALVPFTEEPAKVKNVWGLTTVERPSWLFYVPYTKDSAYPAEFVLQDQESNSIYQKAIALPGRSGVIRVSLPADAPALEVGKQYRWFFSVYCDQQKESPPIYIEGVIQRVNLKQTTVQELDKAEPFKRFVIYAQNGIWYETLTTLAELHQKNPQDTKLQAEWRDLLASIGLDKLATEPIFLETR